jgi:hypothetical protein
MPVYMNEPLRLEPLLAIKSIETLVLRVLFDLSDAGSERVALAWPEIEQLH